MDVIPDGRFQVTYWRAGDISEHCRAVLSSYDVPCRPLHIMDDICARAPAEVRGGLEHLLAAYQARFKALAADADASHLQLAKQVGREFMHVATAYMREKQGALAKEANCHCHGTACQLHPPHENRTGLYIVVAGWTCVPWSSMSQARTGWLHSCSIPFLIWLYTTLEGKPDVIVGECVPLFDDELFREMVTEHYDVQVEIVSPRECGVPSDRRRKYMIATRRDTVQVHVPYNRDGLQETLWRRLLRDGRIYFRAPKSEVTAAIDRSAAARSLPTHGWSAADVLDHGKYNRLQGYAERARDLEKEFVLVNLQQNPSFWTSLSGVCPALLRSSLMYGHTDPEAKGKRFNRMMLAMELFGVQGIPVLMPADHPLTRILPRALRFNRLRHDDGQIPENQYRSMAGNGQHTTSVGGCLLFVVMGLCKKPLDSSS